MKNTIFYAWLCCLFCLPFSIQASHYKSFKVSIYARAYEVEKMKDLNWLDSTWTIISSQMPVDKIYLETHRDLLIVPDETLNQAKQYFQERGVETGGGITYTINERNHFETFCYSNPEHRKLIREIAEHTARHFDDFILDDFFFTSCKSDQEIKARGTDSWSEYRLKLMTEAGENLVLKPARKVNPKVQVIIKYPNWYDHFQALGFDLEKGPQLFDGIWSGTESRDPASDQHLQNYLSYNIVRYFDNLRPGYNMGGWVDNGGVEMGMDRYVEQLWNTLFAKAPEIALFAYHQLIGTPIRDSQRTPWQDQQTSFSFDAMLQPVIQPDGSSVKPTTMARAAGMTFETLDSFVWQLGNPIGIKSYKPFHSEGENFLQNYLGMIGLPMDMHPQFPTGEQVVLLTEQAKKDEYVVQKIKKQLQAGGDVVITTGLLKAISPKIAEIAELHCDDLKALVNDFGKSGGEIPRDILIPQVRYYTNDSWEIINAGRPLKGGVSGYPVLLRSPYSAGNLYVLTIPDDFGNLYDYPEKTLNQIRKIMSRDLGIWFEGPAKVSLFVYDNNTFIIESYQDEPVTVRIHIEGNKITLQDILTAEIMAAEAQSAHTNPEFRYSRTAPTTDETIFEMTVKPHSYRVFKQL